MLVNSGQNSLMKLTPGVNFGSQLPGDSNLFYLLERTSLFRAIGTAICFTKKARQDSDRTVFITVYL